MILSSTTSRLVVNVSTSKPVVAPVAVNPVAAVVFASATRLLPSVTVPAIRLVVVWS
jgi:hypothetical protein